VSINSGWEEALGGGDTKKEDRAKSKVGRGGENQTKKRGGPHTMQKSPQPLKKGMGCCGNRTLVGTQDLLDGECWGKTRARRAVGEKNRAGLREDGDIGARPVLGRRGDLGQKHGCYVMGKRRGWGRPCTGEWGGGGVFGSSKKKKEKKKKKKTHPKTRRKQHAKLPPKISTTQSQ